MNFEPSKPLQNGIPDAVFHEFILFLDALSLVNIDAVCKIYGRDFKFPSDADKEFVENSYDYLIPFLVESAIGQRDIYCYDFEQKSCPKVLVLTEDAIVKKWESISEFLIWMDNLASSS